MVLRLFCHESSNQLRIQAPRESGRIQSPWTRKDSSLSNSSKSYADVFWSMRRLGSSCSIFCQERIWIFFALRHLGARFRKGLLQRVPVWSSRGIFLQAPRLLSQLYGSPYGRNSCQHRWFSHPRDTNQTVGVKPSNASALFDGVWLRGLQFRFRCFYKRRFLISTT